MLCYLVTLVVCSAGALMEKVEILSPMTGEYAKGSRNQYCKVPTSCPSLGPRPRHAKFQMSLPNPKKPRPCILLSRTIAADPG